MHRRMAVCVLVVVVGLGVPACEPYPSEPSFDPLPPPQAQPARELPVPFVAQQTPVWCWAAVSEMVFRYYGRGAAQCQVLTGWVGGDCCRAPGLCMAAAPTMEVIQQTLYGFAGLRSLRAGAPLPFEAVVREIDAGRPLIVAYRGSFSGHVVVVYGYDLRTGTVSIHDPFYGTFHVPYSQTFAYKGQLLWIDTLYGIGA